MRKCCVRAALALLAGMMMANPVVAFETEIRIVEGGTVDVLTIEADDSHDLILLWRDGNELEIEVLMFDPAVFPSVPDPAVIPIRQLRLIADDRETEDYDLNDFDSIEVYCGNGNDVVRTTMVYKPMIVLGEDGDDDIEGGEDDDHVFGGFGTDRVNGKGGRDFVAGGLPFLPSDRARDILTGGAGPDDFSAGERWVWVVVPQQPIVVSGPFRHIFVPLTPSVQYRRVLEDLITDFDPTEDGHSLFP